ncbi:hypothetical protein LCGC14_0821350 [marine sediment metagenome]|uniref:Uncharacterized protein n=1 Tax=marine sediment metagenome TaxID=412755 RepID=A0A0F9Q417_9ZZZZ
MNEEFIRVLKRISSNVEWITIIVTLLFIGQCINCAQQGF